MYEDLKKQFETGEYVCAYRTTEKDEWILNSHPKWNKTQFYKLIYKHNHKQIKMVMENGTIENEQKPTLFEELNEIIDNQLKEESQLLTVSGGRAFISMSIDKFIDKNKTYEVTIKEIVAPF